MLSSIYFRKAHKMLPASWACLCASGQSIGFIIFRLHFESDHWPFASNLEQMSTILCAQDNSASYS